MFGSKDYSCPFFAFISLVDILDVASPDGIVVSCYGVCTVLCFETNLVVKCIVGTRTGLRTSPACDKNAMTPSICDGFVVHLFHS